MKLTELKPRLVGSIENGILIFNCPKDPTHQLRLHIATKALNTHTWAATGAFPDTLTLSPIINEKRGRMHCWSGYLRDGELIDA